MKSLRSRAGVYGLVIVLGLLSAMPNLLPARLAEQLPGWHLEDAVERSLEVVRRRLNETGLVEPSITRQGSNHILVQMPGVADPAEIRDLLGTTAQMTFHWVAKPGNERRATTMILDDASGTGQFVLEKRVAMQGEHIRDAQMAFNQDTGEPLVNIKLDSEGTQLFGDMTRQNIGRPLSIVLDNAVLTAPVIRGVIGGG